MLSIKHTSLFIILSSDLFLFIPSLLEYISHNTYIYRSRHQTLRASMTIRTNSLDMNCHGLFIAVGQNIGLNHRFLEEHGIETVCWTGLGLRALTDPQLRQFPAWLEAETSADPADPAASSELKAYIINCFFYHACLQPARSVTEVETSRSTDHWCAVLSVLGCDPEIFRTNDTVLTARLAYFNSEMLQTKDPALYHGLMP